MRIVVVSDSHGNNLWINEMRYVFANADCVIHLGDVASDARTLSEKINIPVYYVAGNCDTDQTVPYEICRSIGGVRVFATHGHIYYVNGGLRIISTVAREKEARLCLYGHTHIPAIDNCYGIWFVNPGSVSRPRGQAGRTYAVIEIDKNGEIKPDILTLDS